MHNPKAFYGSFNHPIVNNTGIIGKNLLTICNFLYNFPGREGSSPSGDSIRFYRKPHRWSFFQRVLSSPGEGALARRILKMWDRGRTWRDVKKERKEYEREEFFSGAVPADCSLTFDSVVAQLWILVPFWFLYAIERRVHAAILWW
jgi:hypothetical protein